MANDTTKYYVKGGSNQFYLEIDPGNGGDCDYELAEPGLQFEELTTRDSNTGKLVGTGRFMEVRDLAERKRQVAGDSHQRYFEELAKDPDPKKALRAMKRLDKFQEQFERLAIDRASPVGMPSVERVKDEKFMNLMAQYNKDLQAGTTKDPSYSDSMFIPLSSYQHKLMLKNGRMLRPVYQGEVGMIGSKILCLEEGYGTGTQITVPAQIGNGPRQE